MKIAVCLLTCDRDDYTATTLSTFTAMNPDLDRFDLWHADDASTSDRNMNLAASYGFRTVVQNATRLGWLETRRALFTAAARQRAKWVLFLENDIESLRPFPWDLFDFVVKMHQRVFCLRLYGRFKNAAKTDRCLETHKREGHAPVNWQPLKFAPELAQIGRIQWSAQPCVTKIEPLLALHKTGHEPHALTVRVKKNVMGHIGVTRTTPVEPLLEVAC
jgi:hypothetical protein